MLPYINMQIMIWSMLPNKTLSFAWDRNGRIYMRLITSTTWLPKHFGILPAKLKDSPLYIYTHTYIELLSKWPQKYVQQHDEHNFHCQLTSVQTKEYDATLNQILSNVYWGQLNHVSCGWWPILGWNRQPYAGLILSCCQCPYLIWNDELRTQLQCEAMVRKSVNVVEYAFGRTRFHHRNVLVVFLGGMGPIGLCS
jgi:hypothetical protein